MSKNSTRKIGITIFARADDPQGIAFWSCGAHQNCVYLWVCLRAAGYDARMLYDGNGTPPDPATLPEELRAIVWRKISDVEVDDLDVLVQAGAQVSAAHAARVHANGGKAIAFKFGADYPIDAEREVHGEPCGAIFNGAQFDEVWTTSQHSQVCGAYWEICYRCPVRVLPHIWHPCFVDQFVASFPPDLPREHTPGRAKKRIVILEPNIQLIKTCHIPILICEQAWRILPEKIECVYVTNADKLKVHPSFKTFVENLDLNQSKSADGHTTISFESRFRTPWFLCANGDIVVSHQWIPAANYSHYDALHLGFPLVHNCRDMSSAGQFWYPDFDAKRGARQLIECIQWQSDPEFVKAAQREGQAFTRTKHADARSNVTAHASAVLEVCS